VRTRAAAEDFAALLLAHLQDLQTRGLSRSAQLQAERVLPRLVEHLRGEHVRRPHDVREEHLVRFARHIAEHGLGGGHATSHSTQATYLGAVKRFFSFLARRHILLADPAQSIDLPKTRRLPRVVLSESQARRLMAAPFPGSAVGLRDRAVLETLYGAGIRRGECGRLDLADVDLGQGVLLVRNGKGQKDRWVPVLGRAVLALDRYLKDGRPELVKQPRESALFLNKCGGRLSKQSVSLVVRTHGQALQLRISAHVLRHTCATHLLQGGADVRHVQELLGHQSLQSTQLYTRVAIKDLREVLSRAHPRERRRSRRLAR
jgi:integrase/recombinase XerD